MIAAAQKVERYEIASYGTVRTWASLLGKRDIAALFEEALQEEKDADQKLTGIAERFVNEAAAEAGEEGEEMEQQCGRGRGSSGRATARGGCQVAADLSRSTSPRSRAAGPTSATRGPETP